MLLSELSFKKIDIKVFDDIYSIMTEDFPSDELKSRDHMEFILKSDLYSGYMIFHRNIFISYIFIFLSDEKDFMWLDYFSVLKDFRNMGYGSVIIKSFFEYFRCSGIFLEVDIPTDSDCISSRRINFYKRNSGFLLKDDYLFPVKKDSFLPMYLFYIPGSISIPNEHDIDFMISASRKIIHSDCV